MSFNTYANMSKKLVEFYGQKYLLLEVNEPEYEIYMNNSPATWLSVTFTLNLAATNLLKTHWLCGMQVWLCRDQTHLHTACEVEWFINYMSGLNGLLTMTDGNDASSNAHREKGFGKRHLQEDEVLYYPEFAKRPLALSYYSEPSANRAYTLTLRYKLTSAQDEILRVSPLLYTTAIYPQDLPTSQLPSQS